MNLTANTAGSGQADQAERDRADVYRLSEKPDRDGQITASGAAKPFKSRSESIITVMCLSRGHKKRAGSYEIWITLSTNVTASVARQVWLRMRPGWE
jgi:hypothetical protein